MRGNVLILASLVLLVAGCERQPPNVVVYLIDTLRADHLGAYGYQLETSPAIDELAREGVLFERAYSPDTRTLGSIPSLLTSLHVPSHGVDRFGEAIADDVVTLAEVLAGHGYDTASFVTNVNAGPMAKLDRGFRHFHDAIKTHRDRDAPRGFPEAAFFTWLDQAREGPFFAYVHTAEPHRPYNPPPPYRSLFSGDYAGPITGYFNDPTGYREAHSPEDLAQVTALYDGEVRFADDGIRRLLEGLAERGFDRETLLVITADHGEELYDRGGWNHGHSLYDELLRVPLIIAGERVERGRRITEPAQLVDLAPTLLDLLGLEIPAQFEGESLVPLIHGEAREHFRTRPVFAMTTGKPAQAAVIRAQHKLILNQDGAVELYDVVADPGERTDLADQRPELAAALLKELRSWTNATPKTPDDELAGPRLTDEQEARLRALGYLE